MHGSGVVVCLFLYLHEMAWLHWSSPGWNQAIVLPPIHLCSATWALGICGSPCSALLW